MGCAEDAGWHSLRIVLRGSFTLAQFTRAFASDVTERSAKRSQAFPTRLERDVGDGKLRVPKQRRGALDSTREQVAMRRHPESILERAREVSFGNVTHASQPVDRPLLV